MSSSIQVQKICIVCSKEFVAKTTKTKYCSKKCNTADYKGKARNLKIKNSNTETLKIKLKPIEELKAKEFLTVLDVSKLLNCSTRTVYHYIKQGNLKSLNLGKRMIRIKRTDIDKLFS